MPDFLVPAFLALTQLTAGAQGAAATSLPALSLEQSSSLRCAVAFGLVHQAQQSGDATAARFPMMDERGQEFFVRTAASLMDDLATDRDTIVLLVQRETEALSSSPNRVEEIMPACLLMLEASGI